MVMSCFYLGVIAYSVLVLLYARWKGAAKYHLLVISSWGHIVLSILLTASVFITVKL